MSKFHEVRVKLKSLAEESRIIKLEENRTLREARWARDKAPERGVEAARSFRSLWYHRTLAVRPAAREAHLAYAFLRGTPYAKVEPSGSSPPPLKGARKLAERYGQAVFTVTAWEAWQAAAESHHALPKPTPVLRPKRPYVPPPEPKRYKVSSYRTVEAPPFVFESEED